jgi:hypothetical protein
MAWRVEEFVVTPEQAEMNWLRSVVSRSSHGRYVPAGTYRRLMRDGKTVMSDTPDELQDLWEFKRRAKGKVLINGLGLGCAVRMALAKPEVTHVAVIEIDQEVIDLVGPSLNGGDRLQICCGDALTWRSFPGACWDVVWHDIWDDMCADNLVEMKLLHRRYGRRSGWQGSWGRANIEYDRRRYRG